MNLNQQKQQNLLEAVLSATDIKGSTGSSSYAKVFGDAAWEQLKTYHKHMNYQGSSPLYNEVR